MNSKYNNYHEIFEIACSYFSTETKIETLKCIESLKQDGLGLEGWFRIELVETLANNNHYKIKKIKNKGVDLEFFNGDSLELKASLGLDIGYILKGAENQPCLFLAKPTWKKRENNKDTIEKEFRKKSNVFLKINELCNNWYIGLIYKDYKCH